MEFRERSRAKLVFIAILVVVITIATYSTHGSERYYWYFLQDLYFIPVILSAFWYGLRGALVTSASITILYSPFVLRHWKVFTPEEFESLLEIVVYNAVAAVMGLLRDREQRELRRIGDTERLAAVGKAVATVAHDVRTPLNAISGYTRLVQRNLTSENPDHQKLSIVIKETQRLESLLKDMLDFSAHTKLSCASENISQLVRESFAVVEQAAREKNVRLESLLEDGLPPVTCDGMRIKQMLINLLSNAVDSSPQKEAVTIKAGRGKGRLVIEIMDRGPGIPLEQRPMVFEPFYTTKSHGTGLGLSIVKKIVEAHGGKLEILDNPPRGITFRILLPFTQAGNTFARPAVARTEKEQHARAL